MLDIPFPGIIQEIRWNPSKEYSDVIAVVCDTRIFFLDTELSGDEEMHQRCQELLHSARAVGNGGHVTSVGRRAREGAWHGVARERRQ